MAISQFQTLNTRIIRRTIFLIDRSTVSDQIVTWNRLKFTTFNFKDLLMMYLKKKMMAFEGNFCVK